MWGGGWTVRGAAAGSARPAPIERSQPVGSRPHTLPLPWLPLLRLPQNPAMSVAKNHHQIVLRAADAAEKFEWLARLRNASDPRGGMGRAGPLSTTSQQLAAQQQQAGGGSAAGSRRTTGGSVDREAPAAPAAPAEKKVRACQGGEGRAAVCSFVEAPAVGLDAVQCLACQRPAELPTPTATHSPCCTPAPKHAPSRASSGARWRRCRTGLVALAAASWAA